MKTNAFFFTTSSEKYIRLHLYIRKGTRDKANSERRGGNKNRTLGENKKRKKEFKEEEKEEEKKEERRHAVILQVNKRFKADSQRSAVLV